MSAKLRLLAAVSDADLQAATNEAWQKTKKLVGPDLVARLSLPATRPSLEEWLKTASAKDIQLFIAEFKDKIKREPSAGNVVAEFSCAVLSIIGRTERLTQVQKRTVEGLCSAINERLLPTMLWADFVGAWLDDPAIISRVLTLCMENKKYLEERIYRVIKRYADKLVLIEGQPILVYGYSATIVAALLGLPQRLLKTLKILTPRQSLPNREVPDGELLKRCIEATIPPLASVEVVDDEAALKRLRAGEPGLVLMGCKVIGLRRTGVLEIVNSHNALLYAKLASEVQRPLGVVAGAYKLWPMQTYEKYRPAIVLERSNGHVRNSILPGELVTWVMTEEDIFSQEKLRSEYETCFTIEGIPAASLGECFSKQKRVKRLKDLAPQISQIAKALEVKVDDLPLHFIKAERHYEKLRKDKNWLQSHLGEYVAIIGDKAVCSSENFHELASIVREQYGYGPIFMPRVTKGREVVYLRPRAKKEGEQDVGDGF